MPEQLDAASVVRPSEEDQAPPKRRLEVEPKRSGNRTTQGHGIIAGRETFPSCSDVASRSELEVDQGIVVKARPDFGLPPTVEILDAVLESVFARGRKDRDDVQLQAQAHDATDDIWMLVSTLEPRIIVELRVVGHSDVPPMFEDPVQRPDRRIGQVGPRAGIAALEPDNIEDFHLRATSNDESFDEVPAIQLGASGRTCGQIPAGWGSGTPNSLMAVQCPVSNEDAMNGPFARDPVGFCPQGTSDRGCTIFSQVTVALQRCAQFDDPFLEFGRRVDNVARHVGPIRPTDSIQALAAGPFEPALHGTQADPKSPGRRTLGKTASHGRNQRTTQRDHVFLSCCHSVAAAAYPKPGRGSCCNCGCTERIHSSLENAADRVSHSFHRHPFSSHTDPDPLSVK